MSVNENGRSEAEQLDHDFAYHAPSQDKVARHAATRDTMREAACFVIANVPKCRERSLAITKLEEALFWANAGIARNP